MALNQDRVKKNWDLLIEGDKQGLYECFNIFYDDLYRFGLSMYKDSELIKESIQNLFIELWQIRHKLSEVQNIKQYVFTIYKRIIYKTNKDYLQKNVSYELDTIDESFLAEPSYEFMLVESQTDEQHKRQLMQALSNLSPRQKEIIQMRYFEGISFQEIALRTSLTERTVYNTLHNAIKQLREKLKSTFIILFQLLHNKSIYKI